MQILIPLIQQIITTVCSWVSTIITTFQTIWNQVCSWLPWPLSTICNWVSQVITVIQTIWNYICNTVIQTIITFITYLISILIYIFRIFCIIINIIIGILPFLLCRLGLSPTKKIRICVKVLTDNNGNSQVTPLTIRQNIERTISVYKQCNIEVIITGIDYIVKPQYLTTTCTPLNIFSLWHAWFTQTACGCCNQVTVFFVDELLPTNVSGYTIWGDNWCRVDAGASGDDTTMAHEIGHILNLWHVTDPNNLMYAYYSSTAHNLTTFQCCFIRQSPFITSY